MRWMMRIYSLSDETDNRHILHMCSGPIVGAAAVTNFRS